MILATLTDTEIQNQESLEDYWAEGVRNILADNSEEAQASFLMPFLSIDSDAEEEFLQDELLQYLKNVFVKLQAEGSAEDLYKVASCTQELFPNDLNSLLWAMETAMELEVFDLQSLQEKNFLPILAETDPEAIDQDLLQSTIRKCLRLLDRDQFKLFPMEYFPELIYAFLRKASNQLQAMDMCVREAFLLAEQRHLRWLRVRILEVCLEVNNPVLRFDLLCYLAIALYGSSEYQRSIEIAETLQRESCNGGDFQRAIAGHALMQCYVGAGDWLKALSFAAQYQENLEALVVSGTDVTLNPSRIIISSFFLNYLHDQPRMQHRIRNGLGVITANIVKDKFSATCGGYTNNILQPMNKVLRIGYIASTLSKHSVGWLSRWIFKQHSHEEFQIYIYNVATSDQDEFNKEFFRPYAEWSHYFGLDAVAIAEQIQKDEIDILVDLDSLTLSVTFEVMSLRPAPIQVTWLGWDVSGCPEIDYFIADPHVLPADAEEYYQPKIWRMPQTYVAVDGFEVGVPTTCREDYGIPADAVVYLCGQKSYKHNPDILRLQMQIIREVPNSYLLVKLRGDRDALTNTYQVLANEVGIDADRLRFLEADPDELSHRANLHLADVVLDTFPYNGATTTLETLWAGVPLVTKVGEAFVARNSYAFMTNVGIVEGIAHTDEEYVAWGVRLGKEPDLRQQVSGKLLQSRKTSPLWNTKQFTKEMESAYRQMWTMHQEQLASEHSAQLAATLAANPESTLTAAPIKLHIGGKTAHQDWRILDALDRPEVDFIGNAKDLSQFADNSIECIYASHVLEHFHYQLNNELAATLKEWWRVLQPGGQLMVSVPNLQTICALYANPQMPAQGRFHLMRMILGGQVDEYDVHKVGFDPDTLSMYLQEAGFRDFQIVEEFGLFPDCSSLRFSNTLISLNMIAKK